MKQAPLLILIAAMLLASCRNNNNLIRDGKSDYKIFVSENAITPEKHAAKQLQKYLQEISGAQIPITHQAEKQGQFIYVGFKGAPESLLKQLDTTSFGKEQYIIRSDGENMLIAGGATRGTLYGVMGYLSDYLDCRWYTRAISKIPSQSTIPLSKIDDRQKPAFEYRGIAWKEARDTSWVIHNRVNGMHVGDSLGGNYISYPGGHSFFKLLPPKKYFKDHPEYYSSVKDNDARTGTLNLTNPKVVEIATTQVLDWIKTHPDADVYSVSQNDGDGICMTEACQAIDEKNQSHAGSVFTFVNQIADSVAKVYPDAKLRTYAYAYTEPVPKYVRPDSNIIIQLTHYDYCSTHAIDSNCPVNQKFLDLFNQWKEIAKGGFMTYDYYVDYRRYLLPFPNFIPISKDIKLYADNDVKGMYALGNSHSYGSPFAALKSWLIAQLMWNPDQDARKLMDEFIDYVYGAAAPYIKDYIQLLEDQVTPDTHLGIYARLTEVSYLTPEVIHKADSLFVLAKEAVSDSSELKSQVELAYVPVLYTKLAYFSHGNTAYIPKGKEANVIDEFKHDLKKFHITELAEVHSDQNIEGFMGDVKMIEKSSFLTNWWVTGPFDGLTKTYNPEKGKFDSTQTFEGLQGEDASWEKYKSPEGYIDFRKLLGTDENVLGYAYTTITMPKAETVKFGVGNNDGIKIWINGKLEFKEKEAIVGPNQSLFTSHLQKGENTILVKLNQQANAWGFYLSLIEE